MFKKKMLLTLFVFLCECLSIHATMEKQSAVFSHCDTQILLDASSLKEVFDYVMKGLDQKGTGSLSVSYTEAGYTFLQALQKGGYLNLTVENSTGTTYIDWLIQKSATYQKKQIYALLKKVKNTLGASSYTTE